MIRVDDLVTDFKRHGSPCPLVGVRCMEGLGSVPAAL